jgi:hypothetical protein
LFECLAVQRRQVFVLTAGGRFTVSAFDLPEHAGDGADVVRASGVPGRRLVRDRSGTSLFSYF